HINKLGQAAQRDPELAQIYQSIATEDGVIKGGNKERGIDQNGGEQNSNQDQSQQLDVPSHNGTDSTGSRFNPPMRLGGPKPAQGAFEPVAPTPGNVPQQAEARSYTPSPSESAAFYARR